MASYSRRLLSASASGRPIPVVATASPGTLIHIAAVGAAAFDEVYLWASNITSNAVSLTIQFGGTAVGDSTPGAFSIPPNSPPIPILTGQVLNGGLSVLAFAGTASAINLSGFVNAIA